MSNFQRRTLFLTLSLLVLLLLPLGLAAQTRETATPPPIRSVVVSIATNDANGQTHTLRVVTRPEIKSALGATRSLLLDALFGITTVPPLPEPYIFHCGGDIEQSSGTCNDVIVMCATIGIDFECNKEDDEGVCTNGGC